MRNLNRLNQFNRLWQLSKGETGLFTVGELAEHCFCSERHMRTLLSQFSRDGWLTWQAHSGRGKRGTLTFLTSPHAERTQLLEQALAAGAHDTALSLAQLTAEQLRQTLRPLMGGRWVNDSSTLRIPYYRSLDALHPGFLSGRAEQHLASQVFSGLTRFDDDSPLPQPDMAHHWTVNHGGLEWLFFIRTTLRWHDGSRITPQQICTRLRHIVTLPALCRQFEHIEYIDVPVNHCLRIRLRAPDYWLPYRLASYGCRLAHPEDDGCGCGPFRLTVHSPERVRLECHESYHLSQPLLNAIEYWIAPELFEQQIGTSCRHPVQIAVGEQAQLLALRPVSHSLSLGFCYLAIRPDGQLSPEQARYIMALIQHHRLAETLPLDAELISQSEAMLPGLPIPGYSLTPRVPLPSTLTLAYHLPMELHAMAQRLKERLADEGCTLHLIFHQGKNWEGTALLANADLVMGDRLIGESPVWTLEQWLRCHFLWSELLNAERQLALQATLNDVQSRPDASDRDSGLREVMADFMAQAVILPLFHYHYQISAPPGIHGITMNARGWFDFTRAWLPPPGLELEVATR